MPQTQKEGSKNERGAGRKTSFGGIYGLGPDWGTLGFVWLCIEGWGRIEGCPVPSPDEAISELEGILQPQPLPRGKRAITGFSKSHQELGIQHCIRIWGLMSPELESALAGSRAQWESADRLPSDTHRDPGGVPEQL